MLMMCWFYCVDLVWFLYYAIGPILLVCGMFALKRGIANRRKPLRENAFMMMGCVIVKMFLVDPIMRVVPTKMKLCQWMPKLSVIGCDAPDTSKGYMTIIFLGVAGFIVAAYALYEAWKLYMPDREPKMVTPQQIHLEFWANLSFTMLVVMVGWQLAPWVGYLTVGCVPKIFTLLTWQHLAIANLALLIIGFWKLESCVWQYKVEEKEKMKYMHSSWTPKDTLWMSVFVYCITIAMSYVAHDLMARTKTVPEACVPGQAKQNREWNTLDLNDLEVYR